MAISKKLLNDDENVVVSTRTHVKALLGPLLVMVLILAAAVVLDHFVGDRAEGIVGLVVWGVAVLALLWYVARPFLVWLTSTYTVTDQRLITRTGIITRRGHDIPLPRISDVAYEHGLVDRLLGCGTLIVSVASTHGSVVLHDIPHVEETHKRINRLLHEMGDRSERHDGT
ncbi:PH domain-containing protein [Nocardioides sp.]|uniref:PH domain-containing protein n=1 Tax=Nocardioides sp. TaxID=35761 RepID=UPI002733F784|nr:PH domain-containing protein [Nocardioides sp.]MDP3889954.1 PH domain-containing protein [Nocardioides sp.]